MSKEKNIIKLIEKNTDIILTTTPPFIQGNINLTNILRSANSTDDSQSGHEDVPDPLAYSSGLSIAIKVFDGSYVRIEDHDGRLIARSQSIGIQETFELFRLLDNKIGLRGPNGKYVMANIGGDMRLQASAPRISGWEAFEINRTRDNKVYLKAINGLYITANLSPVGHGELVADKNYVSGWEAFTFVVLKELF